MKLLWLAVLDRPVDSEDISAWNPLFGAPVVTSAGHCAGFQLVIIFILCA